MVYAPAWPGAAEFDAAQPFEVHRHPTSLMLPVRSVAATAARDLIGATGSPRSGTARPRRSPC